MSLSLVGRNKAWWSISWVAGKLISYRVIKEAVYRSCCHQRRSEGNGFVIGVEQTAILKLLVGTAP
jgi:hypothetical protein